MIRSVSPTEAPSRILRYLPGRLVVAWAVLGAAAGVALMYAPFVYDGQSSDSPKYSSTSPVYLSRIGTFFSEGRVRVFCKVIYDKKYLREGEAQEAVDWWYCRVAASLAAMGALVGMRIGWREQRRMRRCGVVGSRGGWLWLLMTAAVFVLLVVAGFPGNNGWSLLDQWRWQMRFADEYGLSWSWEDLPYLPWGEIVRLAIFSVVIGWAAQVAGGARGVRLSFGRRPEQAADYGDDVVVPKSG